MNEKIGNISAGEVVVLTAGEYSDFHIKAYIVARVPFNINDEGQRFKEKYQGNEWSMGEAFLADLICREMIVPVKHRELWRKEWNGLEWQ